jgi:hypothetical protein
MKELSVIIVSYRNIDVLCDCLDSIKQYNDIGDALEVIVSDNSDDMLLYNEIKSRYSWITIIKNENKGFGAGNNRGVEVASGKYFLFLNPDTVLVEPIFSFAVQKFERDENLALFGMQLLTKDGKKNSSFFWMDRNGVTATLLQKLLHSAGIFVDGEMFLVGANLFVRAASFEEAGRFDEKIFMYKEESDLIRRIKLYSTAKKTAFFGEKHIIHLEGGTEGTNTRQSVKQFERILETKLYYCKKWNLSMVKMVKDQRRYEKFKLFIYKILRKKERAEQERQLIELFTKYIQKAKELNGAEK